MLYEEGFTQNREISWLRYNERVLEEALDDTVPLLERLRFISIFTSNLEDFFDLRTGSLIHSIVPGLLIKKDMALSAVERQLAKAGVKRIEPDYLGETERGICFDFFRFEIKPRLDISIISSDEGLPVPDEKRRYIIAELDAELEDRFGIIEIPADIPKVFVLDRRSFRYVLTEDIITMFSDILFIPYIPIEVHSIDIAGNAGTPGSRKGSGTEKEIRGIDKNTGNAHADKLISSGRPGHNLETFLAKSLGLSPRQIYTTTRIDFSYIDELASKIPPELLGKLVYAPRVPYEQTGVFKADPQIRRSEAIIRSWPEYRL